MRRHLQAGVWALAVAGVLLTAACSGGTGGGATGAAARTNSAAPGTASATPALSQGPYVALGDSYTSGPQIPTQVGTPSGCDRSSNDYPALVAKDLGMKPAVFRDVSCSSATTADLSAAQSTSSGVNPAQISALSAATRLVTVGIGGNDIGFTSLLTRCVELDLVPNLLGGSNASGGAPCQASYTGGGTDQVQQRIQTAGQRLTAALEQVRRVAPQAGVFVVGYPALVPSGGGTCSRTMGLVAGDVAFLYQEELQLNAMLRQRAEAVGAVYVDTFAPSVGHDACSDPATRWIEPLLPTAQAAAVHPNELGMQGMAAAVLHAISASS